MKYIKNISGSEKTWAGSVIQNNSYYLIQENKELSFSTNDSVIAALSNNEAVMAKTDDGTTDINGINNNINFLKSNLPQQVESTHSPFTKKQLGTKKLFKRVHGITASVQNSPDTIDFSVPYNECKITEIEIIGGGIGDKCDLYVMDTPTGTISGVNDAELNQFGHSVNIAKDYYSHSSSYDADLIKDMKVRVVYDAKDELLPKTIGINIILHELK